jgi:ArsR family transcriptional regulator
VLLAEMLRAVAHPLRLRIIALLCPAEMNVGALAERLDAGQAIVSQHLRILRMSRLVDVTRAGGEARYRLAEPHLRDLIRCVESCERV